MTDNRSIGIFDSGVGGLSITRDIHALIPNEHLIYIADQKFAPYGNQSKEYILNRCRYITEFLLAKQCKAIVVACNTATVNAIEVLRKEYDVPFIGVEPGIKPAALNSNNGCIGVIATEQTVKSDSFKHLVNRFSEHVRIEVQPSPLLVDLVENNDLTSDYAYQVVKNYLQPLLDAGADQIALGCTHYAFLEPIINDVVQGKAAVVNTASPVAAQVKRRLLEQKLLSNDQDKGQVTFFSSNASESNRLLINSLWMTALDKENQLALQPLT